MDITRDRLGRALLAIGACGSIAVTMGNTACVVEGIPACPGRCFEFTLVEPEPRRCLDTDDEGDQYDISFTDGAQTGYRGRYCFNSASLPNVIAATEHIDAGGQLSDLSEPVRIDYVAAVDAVVADIEAECIAAAPGQCDNAADVCSGIAGDAYQQLVVDQTCALEDGGVESVKLGPGEVCHSILDGVGGTGFDDHCTETAGDGGGADETTASGDGADETTGSMLGPFGDLEALVLCDPPTSCEVDEKLLQHVSAGFGVFADEQVTLTLVDRDARCGPGARLDGLDDGEHASALAEAFDVRNGDVIAEIGTNTIVGLDDAMDAVAALLEDPSTALVVRRPKGPGCETLVYAIDVL